MLGGSQHLGNSKRFGNLSNRLEFFDVGGDPKELMAFMVKSELSPGSYIDAPDPGLMPGFESLTNGDITSKRRMVGTMLEGFYRSCYENDQASGEPFAADIIISNPPTFAHIHVAEALGLPLIMSFSESAGLDVALMPAMPWSPTQRFSHPLVNIQRSNAGDSVTNYLSYALADTL